MSKANMPAAIWWLNPFWILVPPLLITSVISIIIPVADYQLYWRMPKLFANDDLLLCWAVALAFTVGCIAAIFIDQGMMRRRKASSIQSVSVPTWHGLRVLLYLGLAATTFAYLLWFGLIVKQTGFGIFLGVLKGVQGSMDELIRLRKDAAITGVTSLTQAGIGVGMLGVFLGEKLGWRKVILPLVLLLGMTMMRAVFLAERLALIEVMLPCMALWFRLRGLSSFSRKGRAMILMAPLAGGIALYVLFTFGESFRSWGYYSEMGETSLLWFSLVRLSGYYVTSLNNGALLWQELGGRGFPYATFGGLWRFPIIGLPLRNLLGGSDDGAAAANLVVVEDANAEFNNPTGIFVVFTDYGAVGAFLFFVFFGIIAMLLYRAFQRGSAIGLWLYPFFFMGLTDQIRTFYVTGGRTWVAWAILITAIFVARMDIKRASELRRRAL
jgi:hypothetical protein